MMMNLKLYLIIYLLTFHNNQVVEIKDKKVMIDTFYFCKMKRD